MDNKSITNKFKTFFANKKRQLIQLTAMIIYNLDVKNIFSGSISSSQLKKICVPGLNCYSCPGAIASCPLGALQNTIAQGKFPFFITGFFLIIGTLFGRLVCSFLCPVGFVQELLYKIKSPKIAKTPKTLKTTRKLSLFKYFVLVAFCIAIPLFGFAKNGLGSPTFCSLFCPAGTAGAGIPLVIFNKSLRSAIGFLFSWKVLLAVVFVVWSIFMFRPFCRFFCPLGAIYSFFNKTAIFGIKVDSTKCTNCNACVTSCKMDTKKINDRECIRCGECAKQCKFNAIKLGK